MHSLSDPGVLTVVENEGYFYLTFTFIQKGWGGLKSVWKGTKTKNTHYSLCWESNITKGVTI